MLYKGLPDTMLTNPKVPGLVSIKGRDGGSNDLTFLDPTTV